MLIKVSSKERSLLVNRSDKKNTNAIKFPKHCISNSKKKITSYENHIDLANEWRQANQYERVIPGQSVLPPRPDLALVPLAKATAIVAAAQLFSHTAGCIDVGKKVINPTRETSTFTDCLSQVISRGEILINQFDNTLVSVIQQVFPWRGVEANPAIIIEPDDKASVVGQSGKIHQSAGILNSVQTASQILNRKNYLKIVNNIKENYPQLTQVASDWIKVALWKKKQYHSLTIDPDKMWFNRFEYSSSSSQSYTGWEHNNYPTESNTLTQMLLKNFGAEDRLNSDALRGNSGIYTQGAEAEYFGAKNEVKILPKDFLDVVVNSDFSEKYLRILESFWLKHRSSYRTMSKGKFIAYMVDKSSDLSDSAMHSVMMAALGDISEIPRMTMAELERKVSFRDGLRVSTFSINGYHATDIILIHGFDGKIILYKPSDVESFVEFNNTHELNNWVLKQVEESSNRDNLLQHFSLYDRQDGHTYSGVHTALNGLANREWAESYINYRSLDIKGDVFSWLASQAEKRTIKDTETLTVSNDEVLKDQVLMNLKPVLITAGLATVVLPGVGSLILLEAGTAEMEVGVFIDIYGDTEAKRFKGLVSAIDGGINVLFGAAGVGEITNMGPNEIADNELHSAQTGPDSPSIRVQDSPPGSWFNRFFKRTIVNGKGIAEIALHNAEEGIKLSNCLSKMDQTLIKARETLETKRGKDIVAAYLGCESASMVTDADIQFVQKNIDTLLTVAKEIEAKKIPVKSIKIYDPKEEATFAYYNPNDKSISFTDKFFKVSDDRRLQIVLHEGMHATAPYRIGKLKKAVPDYFYISEDYNTKNLNAFREDTLLLSAGAVDFNFQRGYDAKKVMENFIKKMGAKKREEAIFKFNYNEGPKKELLLVNPDTQSMLIMELGDQVSGARTTDGPFRIPESLSYFRRKVTKQKQEQLDDAKFSPVRHVNNNEQVSGLR